MKRFPIARVPGGGSSQDLVRDTEGYVIHTYQDCEPILDDNQKIRSNGQFGRHGFIGARVPTLFYYVTWPQEFKNKYGWHPKRPPVSISSKEADRLWRDFFVAKLHDRDFSKFKTDERRFTANG